MFDSRWLFSPVVVLLFFVVYDDGHRSVCGLEFASLHASLYLGAGGAGGGKAAFSFGMVGLFG